MQAHNVPGQILCNSLRQQGEYRAQLEAEIRKLEQRLAGMSYRNSTDSAQAGSTGLWRQGVLAQGNESDRLRRELAHCRALRRTVSAEMANIRGYLFQRSHGNHSVHH